MAPGIVEADPALQPGDWCWVRDERNKQPLAVGKALVPGAAMVRGKGKAVKSVHHVGDKLWTVGADA
jgi:PUA domain protein